MNEVRAFIGHSFLEDDAELIDKFLKYFAQLSKLHSTFTWEHAEAAEPKELRDKVLSIIADKNIFIGLCTKREAAVDASSFSPSLFRSRSYRVEEAALEWKTSDWLIQEIGLAIGRGMELVLLVEEGLRNPGGLQSDVEYIRFERNAPEKSFRKILEMLTALSPKAAATSATLSELGTPDSDAERAATTDIDWKTPMPDWARGMYDIALSNAFLDEDAASIEKIDKAYLSQARNPM